MNIFKNLRHVFFCASIICFGKSVSIFAMEVKIEQLIDIGYSLGLDGVIKVAESNNMNGRINNSKDAISLLETLLEFGVTDDAKALWEKSKILKRCVLGENFPGEFKEDIYSLLNTLVEAKDFYAMNFLHMIGLFNEPDNIYRLLCSMIHDSGEKDKEAVVKSEYFHHWIDHYLQTNPQVLIYKPNKQASLMVVAASRGDQFALLKLFSPSIKIIKDDIEKKQEIQNVVMALFKRDDASVLWWLLKNAGPEQVNVEKEILASMGNLEVKFNSIFNFAEIICAAHGHHDWQFFCKNFGSKKECMSRITNLYFENEEQILHLVDNLDREAKKIKDLCRFLKKSSSALVGNTKSGRFAICEYNEITNKIALIKIGKMEYFYRYCLIVLFSSLCDISDAQLLGLALLDLGKCSKKSLDVTKKFIKNIEQDLKNYVEENYCLPQMIDKEIGPSLESSYSVPRNNMLHDLLCDKSLGCKDFVNYFMRINNSIQTLLNDESSKPKLVENICLDALGFYGTYKDNFSEDKKKLLQIIKETCPPFKLEREVDEKCILEHPELLKYSSVPSGYNLKLRDRLLELQMKDSNGSEGSASSTEGSISPNLISSDDRSSSGTSTPVKSSSSDTSTLTKRGRSDKRSFFSSNKVPSVLFTSPRNADSR